MAGLGIYLPMLVLAYFIVRSEGLKIEKDIWKDRLRFKKMNKADWLWSIGSIIALCVRIVVVSDPSGGFPPDGKKLASKEALT